MQPCCDFEVQKYYSDEEILLKEHTIYNKLIYWPHYSRNLDIEYFHFHRVANNN